MAGGLDRFFAIQESGSTVRRELRAGLTTFLTMAYILFVNPAILGQAIPVAPAQLLFATAIAAAVGSVLMGVLARYPFAQAPGMGLNAYFAFTVVLGQKIPWRVALGAVFIEGLLFCLLSFGGVRQAIVNALPRSLKYALTAGIGLFLALIGLKNAGLVVAHPQTLVALGHLSQPGALLCLAGLVVTAALMQRRVPGAILCGIAAATLGAIALRLPVFPGPAPADRLVAFAGLGGWPVRAPAWPVDLFLAMDLRGALRLGALGIVFTFLFVEIFDTAGTLIGLAARAGFLDPRGELPRANRAFLCDALATSAGAALGTSTTTCYIESAAGIAEGGRTGLCAVTTGVLFALSVFLWPLCAAVPAAATAPALILVGALMMENLGRVEWREPDEAVPAFLCVLAMPLTFSIANGVSFGILAHVAIKALAGKARQVSPVLWGVALVLVARYVWLSES